jgi:FYVE/RhoGEF/PH domain-containing protein 5/6
MTDTAKIFMNPLSQAASFQNPPLSSEEVRITFANIADLSRLSKDLLDALRNGTDASSFESPPQSTRRKEHHIVQVLSTHLPFLAMYSTFITSFPATSTFLRSKRQSSDSFRKFLAEAESNPCAAKLHLEDWLLTIVQRVPRWSLLLRDLLSVTDIDSPEHFSLKQLVLKVDNSTSIIPKRSLTASRYQLESTLPRADRHSGASCSAAIFREPSGSAHQARS